MNIGFTQSLTMATLGRNMQLLLNVTAFFTVKVMLCYIVFSLIKKLEGIWKEVALV
jgi:hypothetical protein